MTAKYLSLEEAIKVSGHPTAAAMDRWVRRLVKKNPLLVVRRRYGAIEQGDLERALEVAAGRMTPSMKLEAAVDRMGRGRGKRGVGVRA